MIFVLCGDEFGSAFAFACSCVFAVHCFSSASIRVHCAAMKAVILAAGKGTRMKELTNELPKPMLRVQGRPILEHIVAGIASAGVRDIFIVTGFRAEVIEQHVLDHLTAFVGANQWLYVLRGGCPASIALERVVGVRRGCVQ